MAKKKSGFFKGRGRLVSVAEVERGDILSVWVHRHRRLYVFSEPYDGSPTKFFARTLEVDESWTVKKVGKKDTIVDLEVDSKGVKFEDAPLWIVLIGRMNTIVKSHDVLLFRKEANKLRTHKVVNPCDVICHEKRLHVIESVADTSLRLRKLTVNGEYDVAAKVVEAPRKERYKRYGICLPRYAYAM